MKWAEHIARMGKKMNTYRISVGKPYGKRPLERPRSRWVNNVKKDLKEIEWDSAG
jgi:late competence protein required for DNA uptake (superfamily II DNA/RNA helicase)